MNRGETNPRSRLSWGIYLTVWALVLLAIIALAFIFFFSSRIGIEQPIPFSHKVHVNSKKLSCIFCHPGALTTPVAGIPPLETCMLCHQHIIIHYPPIERLRAHYEAREPVRWLRINNLPDFNFFNHQVHGATCGHCRSYSNNFFILLGQFNQSFAKNILKLWCFFQRTIT